MAALAKCVPNSTFQSSFDAEGKGYVLLCRNYEYRSRDAQALDPKYDDLAMIIYDTDQPTAVELTGLFCFAGEVGDLPYRWPDALRRPNR